jgi:hypothetical protein
MGMLVFLALLAGISSCFVKEDLRRTNATSNAAAEVLE